jgi:hypothetical protein
MKLTLLEIVQDMLTATDSENVSTVGETEDAGMCVNIANREFERLISKFRWRHTRTFGKLVTRTNLHEMNIPTTAIAIVPNTLYYEGDRVYWMDADSFLSYTLPRLATESNIVETGDIKVYTDRNPQYYTSFNDEVLVFDAYPTASGLVAADTDCILYNAPTSRLTSDGDFFDLPPQAFPALVLRCITKAIAEIKGDTQGAQFEKRDADNAVAALSRNARLVDVFDDRRDHIVPRRSMRNTFNRTVRIIA